MLLKGKQKVKSNGKLRKILKILLPILLVVGCFCWYFQAELFRGGPFVFGKPLLGYSYSSGGGMQGGFYSERISTNDQGEVILTIKKSDSYYGITSVREYLLDPQVLVEIREIFSKYQMHMWHGKRLSGIFVADGDSSSYSFYFENYDTVSFSSQVIPGWYRSKLDRIDEIIRNYMENAEELPGLDLDGAFSESKNAYTFFYPEDGQVRLFVSECYNTTLSYLLLNGTEDEVAMPTPYRLYNKETGEVIAESDYVSDYPDYVYGHSNNGKSISLEQRLEPGNYCLELGEYSCEFVIK